MENNAPKIWTIPNGVTLLNVLSGTIGILAALYGRLYIAGVMVLIAAVFDFLDGFMARILKSSSPAGKELDSLADMVSFSVLPGFISFQLMQLALFGTIRNPFAMSAHYADWIFLATCAVIPLLSALRLAKFNVDSRQSESFIGLATPANAIFFAALVIIISNSTEPWLRALILNPKQLAACNLILSALLVSEIPMFSFKFKSVGFKENKLRYLFIIYCVILLVVGSYYTIPLIILSYIILSILTYFFQNKK